MHVLGPLARLGVVRPRGKECDDVVLGDLLDLRAAADPERVAEIEETTQHDVIAFLTAWADNTEPRSAAAYVHHGMTSSDLLDTALAVQLTDATDMLLAKADRLVAALRDPA